MTFTKTSDKLSLRLVTATLIYSLIIATLVTVFQLVIIYQTEKRNSEELLNTLMPGISKDLAQSLWDVDKKRINTILDSIASLQNFGYILLKDEEGNKYERNLRKKGNSFLSSDFNVVHTEDGHQKLVGDVHFELSKEDIFLQLKGHILSVIITTISTLLLGSILVLVLFQQWVSRHLEKMALFTKELDLNNLDQRLSLDRTKDFKQDELSSVVEAINRMLERMQNDLELRERIEKELLSHKLHLEEKIQERTQEIRQQNNLLQSQREILESQNKELDAYAHSVAHDLKTPLTSLIGFASLISTPNAGLSAAQKEQSIQSLLKIARKMGSIIDALLTLASVRKTDELNLEPLDMLYIAHEACNRLTDFSVKKNARINFIGDLPKALGHNQWIEEVWVNFISNAVKYGGEKPIIEIGSEPLTTGKNKYWVRDHGAGISPEKQAELFKQFSRLDPQAAEGHGLGLSIVKRIVERLGGEVGYELADGGGSRFWFTLENTN